MRRAIALAAALSILAGSAAAETWTKFHTMENGADISYDSDYTYKDSQTGRLIVMQAPRPNQPLDIKANWRSDTPKKAEGADNTALIASVCPHAEHAPVK